MEPVIAPYKEVYKEMQKAKQLNSISFSTRIQSPPWPWYLCYLITVTTFSQDTGIILINTNTNVFLFYNLKVSHPRCVVKNKYVKKILFCTVTKHN